MNEISYLLWALIIVLAAINGLSVFVWLNLRSLIGQYDGPSVTAKLTAFLYAELMRGRNSSAPTMVAVGNPDRDPTVRAVKGSDAYSRLKILSAPLRALPPFIHFVPTFLSNSDRD